MNKFLIILNNGEMIETRTENTLEDIVSYLNIGFDWIKVGDNIIRIRDIEIITSDDE